MENVFQKAKQGGIKVYVRNICFTTGEGSRDATETHCLMSFNDATERMMFGKETRCLMSLYGRRDQGVRQEHGQGRDRHGRRGYLSGETNLKIIISSDVCLSD